MALKILPQGHIRRDDDQSPPYDPIEVAAESKLQFRESAGALIAAVPGEWNHGLTHEQAEEAYQLTWNAYSKGEPITERPDVVGIAARKLMAEWRAMDAVEGDRE